MSRMSKFMGWHTLVVEGPTVVVVSPPESSPPSMWRKIRSYKLLPLLETKQARSWTSSNINKELMCKQPRTSSLVFSDHISIRIMVYARPDSFRSRRQWIVVISLVTYLIYITGEQPLTQILHSCQLICLWWFHNKKLAFSEYRYNKFQKAEVLGVKLEGENKME